MRLYIDLDNFKTEDLRTVYAMAETQDGRRITVGGEMKAWAVEDARGEWFAITQPWLDTQIFKCTRCSRTIEVPAYEVSTLTIRYPFCHCGCDMRGGK